MLCIPSLADSRSLEISLNLNSEIDDIQELDKFQNIYIVIYSIDMIIAQNELINEYEFVSRITPIVTKRLDFNFHKTVNSILQKHTLEINDS